MRRFTLVTLICLLVLLVGAGVYQLVLANKDVERFPGPEVDAPLPTLTGAP